MYWASDWRVLELKHPLLQLGADEWTESNKQSHSPLTLSVFLTLFGNFTPTPRIPSAHASK
jgi:hypothetical protein